MNQRDTSLFGSQPGLLWWDRGGEWKFVSDPDTASDEPAMSDRLRYVMPEWVNDLGEDAEFIRLPGTASYYPLTEEPYLYLAFATLGEKVWANPELSVAELAELALEFTRDYGALERAVISLEDIIEEAKTVAWMVTGNIAVGDTAEANEAIELFWQRAIAKHPEIDSLAKTSSTVQNKRDIASIMGGVTNRHMKTYDVWQQIQVVLGDPEQQPGFEPTYEPKALRGALWVQLASLLMRTAVLRRCEYKKCRKIFEAPSALARHEYCPSPPGATDGCQIKAKNQRNYQKRVTAKRATEQAKQLVQAQLKDGK